MNPTTGRCTCGAVVITASGAPDRVGICHCIECRRHHGALFYAAAIFPEDRVEITGDTHAYAGRHFCPICGASVFAKSTGEVELHLGALDALDQHKPSYECWTTRRAEWLPDFTDLVQHLRNRDDA